jgi:hypothetical protein
MLKFKYLFLLVRKIEYSTFLYTKNLNIDFQILYRSKI